MIRAASWLIVCAILSAQAVGQQPLPCEASASCALRMARDAAFGHFETAQDLPERALSLVVLIWIGEQDKALNGETLRGRFTVLRKKVDQLPDNERELLLAGLAITLAASDLIDEARAIAVLLPTEVTRGAVRAAIACGHARRGRVREAFAALDTMQDQREKRESFRCVLDGITNTGKPDLAREVTKYLSDPPPEPVDITQLVALTELAAGNHTAARTTAMSNEDAKARIKTLYQLMKQYEYLYNYAEATATARLLSEEIGKLDDPKLDANIRSSVIYRLIETYTPADIPALIHKLPAEERDSVLRTLAFNATDPAVIREAGRLLAPLAPRDREDIEESLLWARMRAGDIEPVEALAQTSRPEHLAFAFMNPAGGPPEMLQVAIAAKGSVADVSWELFAKKQARLGLLAEARETIDSRIRDQTRRGRALIGMSGVEAAQGSPENAARTRDAGMRLLQALGISEDHYSVAELLEQWGNLDAAESELRAGMRANTPGLESHNATINVISERARRGEINRAMELAAHVSRYLQDNPEPFLLVYAKVAGVGGVCLHTPLLRYSCRID